jgi:hypothetical protein
MDGSVILIQEHLLQMNDSTQGDPVNKGNFYPANYDKPHDITIAANYRISHRYSVSWNATYSTGRPITLPIGRFDYAGGGRTLYADRNTNRIPDYFRMDFAITLDGNHKVNQIFIIHLRSVRIILRAKKSILCLLCFRKRCDQWI